MIETAKRETTISPEGMDIKMHPNTPICFQKDIIKVKYKIVGKVGVGEISGVYKAKKDGQVFRLKHRNIKDTYFIVGKIGAGGYSSVYKVKKDGQVFLLKVLRKGKSNDALTKEKYFVDETHKNVQSGTIVIGDEIFPATIQNCDNGISLEDIKDISLEKLIIIIKDLLKFAGEQRHREIGAFTHYDIKPANVLVNDITGDIICLLDYGSACTFEDHSENDNIASTESFYCLDSLQEDPQLINYIDFEYDVGCVLGSFWEQVDTRKLEVSYSSQEYTYKWCIKSANRHMNRYLTEYARYKDENQLYMLRTDYYKQQLCQIADDITIDIMRFLDNIVTLNNNTIEQTSRNYLKIIEGKYKNYPYNAFEIPKLFNENHVYFNSFFRERREIAYVLALRQPDDRLPFVFEMDHTYNSENDILYGITKTLTGKRVSFDYLTSFISGYDYKNILFIAVIRCYSEDLVKCFVDKLNLLIDKCDKIKYVILTEKNFWNSITWDTPLGVSSRDFPYEFIQRSNIGLRKIADIKKKFEDWNSFYYTRHYHILDTDGDNTSNNIQKPQDLDIRLLANKAMGTLDDNKYNRLSTLIIDKFNGREQESREILPSEILPPLTAEDIILFAERTGIITVTQDPKTKVLTVIKNMQDVLMNKIMGALDGEKYDLLNELIKNKFSDGEQTKTIRHSEIKRPLKAKDIILFAEKTGIITVTKRNRITGALTVTKNTQDVLTDKIMGTLDNGRYILLSELITNIFSDGEQTKIFRRSEIKRPLTAEDIILFAAKTGIITVTQDKKTQVLTVTKNTQDVLTDKIMGTLDNGGYILLSKLITNIFSDGEQTKKIRRSEIKRPLTAKDIILFAEKTGIITVTKRNRITGALTVINNTQDVSTLTGEKYNLLSTLINNKFSDGQITKKIIFSEILPSEIISPLTAEDIILFAERTGIITVTEYNFDTGTLTVTPGTDLFDSLLDDYNANDFVTNFFGDYLKRMSGSILSKDYIQLIADKMVSKLKAISNEYARNTARNKLFGKLKEEFPPMRFDEQPKLSNINSRPKYKLSDEEYYLSENICQLVCALDGNDSQWQWWLKSIHYRVVPPTVARTTPNKLNIFLAHKYAWPESRVIKYIISLILICVGIPLIFLLGFNKLFTISSPYNEFQEYDSNIYNGSILTDKIYLGIKNNVKDGFILNSLKIVSSESEFYINDISTINISVDSQFACKAIYFTPNTIDHLLHVNDVKINNESHPCDFWYMPESSKATFTVSNFPTTAGYMLDDENDNRKISFYLTITSPETFEVDEDGLKDAFYFTVDGNKNVLKAKKVEITPRPEFFDKPNEVGYIVTMFVEKSASNLYENGIYAQLCIDTNDIVRYFVGNGQVIQHFEDDFFYNGSVTLADSVFYDKDVDASSLILNPDINVISRSASNAKYVIFEPESIPDECSVDFFLDDTTSISYSGGLLKDNLTDSDHRIESIVDGTADSISDIEYKIPYYVYNNCGQYIARDVENVIPRTIGDNGIDTTPPVVEVKSVEEQEDGKFLLKLLIKDDYPLPMYNTDNNDQLRWECDGSFVYGAKKFSAIDHAYPMRRNGVEDTSCIEISFEIEPTRGYDSIIIAPGFITDAAGIPNDKVVTCHLNKSPIYAQFDTLAKVYDPDKEYRCYNDYINGEDVADFSKPDAFYYVVSYFPAEEIKDVFVTEPYLNMRGFYGTREVKKIPFTNSYALIFTDVEYTSEYGIYIVVNSVTAISHEGEPVNYYCSPVMDPRPLSAKPIGGLEWDPDAPTDLIGKVQLRFSDGSVPGDDIILTSTISGFNCTGMDLIHIEDDVFQIRFSNASLNNSDGENVIYYYIRNKNLQYNGETVRCSDGYSESTTLTNVNTSDRELVRVEKTDG